MGRGAPQGSSSPARSSFSLSCLLTSCLLSVSTGFPVNKYAISEILYSEMISTIDHLREERALFAPEYFQQRNIPRVLSNILSEEIQKLGRSETTPPDQDQEGNQSPSFPRRRDFRCRVDPTQPLEGTFDPQVAPPSIPFSFFLSVWNATAPVPSPWSRSPTSSP
jgi:hypothetical protein